MKEFENMIITATTANSWIHPELKNWAETTDELIEDVVACYEAGAAIAHVHLPRGEEIDTVGGMGHVAKDIPCFLLRNLNEQFYRMNNVAINIKGPDRDIVDPGDRGISIGFQDLPLRRVIVIYEGRCNIPGLCSQSIYSSCIDPEPDRTVLMLFRIELGDVIIGGSFYGFRPIGPLDPCGVVP